MALALERVAITGGPLLTVANEEVDAVERDLATPMPDGYREYITMLGWGTLETFIRVLPPSEILAGLLAHRGSLAGYWSWGSGAGDLDQDALSSSIEVANTLHGDHIAFMPGTPRRLIILPRHSGTLIVRDEGLLETVEWILSSGVLVRRHTERRFEPFGAFESRPVAAIDGGGPAPSGSPSSIVGAWLSALHEVEHWRRDADGTSRDDEAHWEAAAARADDVHRRYLTPALAWAFRGDLTPGTSGGTTDFEITGERPGRNGDVLVDTREGIHMVSVRRYTLTPDGEGYRIAQVRELDIEFPGG